MKFSSQQGVIGHDNQHVMYERKSLGSSDNRAIEHRVWGVHTKTQWENSVKIPTTNRKKKWRVCKGRPQHGRHQFSLGPVCPLLTVCCDLTIPFLSQSIINIHFDYSFIEIFGKGLVLSTQYCFCPILLNLYFRNIYVPTHPEFISCHNIVGISCAGVFGETDICKISGRVRNLGPVCPLLTVCCDLTIPFCYKVI